MKKTSKKTGTSNTGTSYLINGAYTFHNIIKNLDNSKLFAGIIMILLNVGSKFISIQFSQSTEEYLKMNVSKQLLVFSMAWMGTREIYPSLMLTAAFVILSEHLFNEESKYCIVPHKYRILNKLVDANKDGVVSETELNEAIRVLERSKKEKNRTAQKEAFSKNFASA
jgi:hypothetical protein